MAALAHSKKNEVVSQTKLSKSNFGIAKLIKGEELPPRINFLHITPTHTEVTDGRYFVRIKNTEEGPSTLETLLAPEDAANIATSLKKKDFVTNVIVADDHNTAQVEFDSGEIRILPIGLEAYPDTSTVTPKGEPVLSVMLNPECLVAILSNAFRNRTSPFVTFEFYGAKNGVRIISGADREDPEIESVLMPTVVPGLEAYIKP